MSKLAPYLYFNGSCRDAMEFYQTCFGGELKVMTFADAQGDACPAARKNLVMHATLVQGDFLLMASDAPDEAPIQGDNVQISIDCSSMDEIKKIYSALSRGGEATMPLNDTFWGAHFGMLTDRHGVYWMLNFDKPKTG